MNAQELETKPELHQLLNEYLIPTFIDPLKEIGFEFQDYNHIDQGSSIGTHALLFHQPYEKDIPDLRARLIEICNQDDDSQPYSTYRYYLRTLFLYIPYFA